MSLEQKEIFENSNKHSSRIDYLNGLEFRHSSTLRDSEIQRNGNSCIFANKFINKLVVFNSGKIFNMIFLVQNKDNILRR